MAYSGNSTNSSVIENMDITLDNLYPAIIQCFTIILFGYIGGRIGLINSTQGKGIGTFVSNFCLPALLFKNMIVLDFRTVNWIFLAGILISKSVVFLGVLVITLIAKRPLNYGYAGLFGIFATQSNDFALGYPILQALFQNSHPDYLRYIYLIAPISVVFLNPIGFTLLEIQKRKHQIDKDSKVHSGSSLGPESGHQKRGTCIVMLHVLKGVISNPIVFMTVVGIAGNFIFKQHVPVVIGDVLNVLGNAFSASALFYLGLSLVGKIQGAIGFGLLVPLLLISAKALILPLIVWQIVGALEKGLDTRANSTSLSMYGFLYGTFPTAPSVFLYASQYSTAQETIATGMVAGTFLSAPLMFMSAKMMTVVVNSEMDYKSLLLETSFDTSIISVVTNIWMLFLLLTSRRYKKMPHQFLLCFVISHLTACIGMMTYSGQDTAVSWKHYLEFCMILIGVLSSRCWTAMISLSLYLLHCRSLCFVLRMKWWMYLFGFGLPVFCTGLLLLLGTHHMHDEINPSFHYGIDQTILSVFILLICSVINVTCLILKQRKTHHQYTRLQESSEHDKFQESAHLHSKKTKRKVYQPKKEETHLSHNEDGPATLVSISCQTNLSETSKDFHKNSDYKNGRKRQSSTGSGDARSAVMEGSSGNTVKDCTNCASDCYQAGKDFEDIVPFPTEHDSLLSDGTQSDSSSSVLSYVEENVCTYGTCDREQKRICTGLIRSYNAGTVSIKTEEDGVQINVGYKKQHKRDQYQTGRFIVLLIAFQISMLIGIFLCTWRLFNKIASGIYVEIEFLDGVFNYGQGFILFAIFGFDTRFIFLPCIRRWRRFMYGVEVIQIPDREDLDEETLHLCEQFVKYHKWNCIKSIVTDQKFRLREYKDVFTGTDMCDWLIEVGLTKDRSEAVAYGRALVIGQEVCHVTKEHHFYDMPYFYRFVDDN